MSKKLTFSKFTLFFNHFRVDVDNTNYYYYPGDLGNFKLLVTVSYRLSVSL